MKCEDSLVDGKLNPDESGFHLRGVTKLGKILSSFDNYVDCGLIPYCLHHCQYFVDYQWPMAVVPDQD